MGPMVPRANRRAAALADFASRTEVGRCDAKARGETGGYCWLVTRGDYARESAFARWRMARYVRSKRLPDFAEFLRWPYDKSVRDARLHCSPRSEPDAACQPMARAPLGPRLDVSATRAGDGWLWYAMGFVILLFGGEERFRAMACRFARRGRRSRASSCESKRLRDAGGLLASSRIAGPPCFRPTSSRFRPGTRLRPSLWRFR